MTLRAGFLASGSTLRSSTFPDPGGIKWRRPKRPEDRLAGYSGGTAQVFDLFPFWPLTMRGTLSH
jgi:hypothetical protein